jgi:hypothetical protein
MRPMTTSVSVSTRRISGRPPQRQHQSGAVAVLVGIALLAMVAITGFALDLGKLYVVKSELQNSVDACAVAAAQELTGANDNQLTLAQAAGIAVGGNHKVLFQKSALSYGKPNSIEFSPDNSAGSFVSPTAAGSTAKSMRYVRCTVVQTGIPTWFIQVLSALPGHMIGPQQVSATAVATLKPSQSTCALPVSVCSNTTTPVKGNWYMGAIDPNDTSGKSQSAFRWIDFTPPSGGATELAQQLAGSGACDVPTANSFVSETGTAASLANDYNTRFGIYQGNANPAEAAPDYSGYAYTTKTWPLGRNAFPDFSAKRAVNAPYQNDSASGLKTQGTIKDANFLRQNGRDRRVMPAPLVDCGTVVNNKMRIQSWGCFFLLQPVSNKTGNGNTQYPRMMLEYVGSASVPGSPCASYGLPGGSGAYGPLVATLVR